MRELKNHLSCRAAAARAGAHAWPPAAAPGPIHLTTLQLLGEPPERITVLTNDHRVREHATALGFCVA